jgi:predicted DNA-binding transcriptional regulator AlpA
MTTDIYPAAAIPGYPPAMQVVATPALLDESGVLHHLGQVRLGVGEKAPGGMSRATLHKLISQGEFPRPVPISAKQRGKGVRQAWPFQLVESWVRDRLAIAYGDRFPRDTYWAQGAWADGDEPSAAT